MRSLKAKKAPGPDGIPNEVLKIVTQQKAGLLLDIFNACLKSGMLSSRWKVAWLVLIRKGKGDLLPSSFRPLYMLDAVGKLYERLLALAKTEVVVLTKKKKFRRTSRGMLVRR